MSIQSLVAEFQTAFAQEPDPTMQYRLIREETVELFDALQHGDPYEVAKEMADLAYVLYGLAQMLKIDLDKVIHDVHKSNMSKLGEDGKPQYREDGKVLKGPNYLPPIFTRKWMLG